MAGEAVPLDARPQGTSCFAILETHFQVSNPLFKRRSELLKLKPTQGEQFTSYMNRLKETSEECDLQNISHEDVILLIATMHCNKEELRKDIKHIFETQPETLQYNAAQRFRGPNQYLVQGLFTHFILNHDQGSIVKRARFQNLSASYCKRVPFLLFWLNCQLFRLLPWRFRLICVNDLALLNQRFKGRAETILRRALGIS